MQFISKSMFVVAGVAATGFSQMASASFIVTLSTPVVSGNNTIYQVQATNDGVGTGTKLQSINATITTPGTTTATALIVDFRDTDGDGVADANILGSQLAFGSSSGTFERVGAALTSTFFAAGITPSAYTTDPDGTGAPTQAVDAAYSNLHSLNIQGIYANAGHGVADATPISFANIVVPTGTTFSISGSIAGDAGAPQSFTTGVSVPEPASLALLGLGGLGMLKRRRKA